MYEVDDGDNRNKHDIWEDEHDALADCPNFEASVKDAIDTIIEDYTHKLDERMDDEHDAPVLIAQAVTTVIERVYKT